MTRTYFLPALRTFDGNLSPMGGYFSSERLRKSTPTRLYWLPIVLLILLNFALVLPAQAEDWRPIDEGVDYQEFLLPGPVRLYVARMDRSNPNVTLETSLGNRQLESGKDTVSKMVSIYDESLTFWEPDLGSRMKVVAAINGSFHDIESGVPQSGMIQGGSYIKKYDDLGGGSGFVWLQDRSAFIGTCVNHPEDEQLLTVLRTGASYPIRAINSRTRNNALAIYTHQYGRRTPERAGLEIRVAMDQPLSILAEPEMATGVVTAFHDNGRNPIGFDEIILVPRGTAADFVMDQLVIGDRVGISMEIDHYQSDCQSRRGQGWSEAYASLSGSFEFLMDGEIRTFDDIGALVADPRTAICYNDDYLHFVVVDGRQQGFSQGMTIEQLAEFCRDRLDSEWGINQDGGGSSAMWVDGEIVNRPSDGNERAVANGLMMVSIQPKEVSDTFEIGQSVRSNQLIDLSVGPGTNFQTPVDIGADETGVILDERNGLQGVFATGAHWWKVKFGDRQGWVKESALDSADAPNPSPRIIKTPAIDDPKSMLASRQWLLGRATRRFPARPLLP